MKDENFKVAKESAEWYAILGNQDESQQLLPHGIDTLYCKGRPAEILGNPSIHRFLVTGTRDEKADGREAAIKIVRTIAQQGKPAVLISGLAMGIDATALETALLEGIPVIAVLPSPLDDIYPMMHRGLAEKILERGGALITHMKSGKRPTLIDFLTRNTIRCLMANTAVIAEAKKCGSSIIIARTMNTLGKRVLAVPGNPDRINSQGCNNLIREGSAEILADYGQIAWN